MKQIHIATHFEKKQTPADLYAYALGLYNKHSGNIWYPGPTNPTLANFLLLVVALNGLIAAWGSIHNRGTSQSHQDLMDGVKALKEGINGLKHYDENTTPGNASAFLSAGWEITEATPGPVGAFPAPTGLHVVYEKHIVIPGRIHYGWNAVHGASGYKVWCGTGALPLVLPPDSSLPYQTVTHGHFDDIAASALERWIIVGCVGTNPATGYATLSGNIVP